MPFAATWRNLEVIILREINQKEKDKYPMTSHMWNLKYDTNEFIYKRTQERNQTIKKKADKNKKQNQSRMPTEELKQRNKTN